MIDMARLRAAFAPQRHASAASVCVHSAEETQALVVTRTAGVPAPFSVDASFLLYSITKTVAATLALRLVERGRCALDAPIARLWPEAPRAGAITLRQLLQHTSGLPDYGGLAQYHADVRAQKEPWSDEEFFARTGAATPLFPAGQGWAYSNVGYLMVKRLVERAGGQPFPRLVRDELRLFVPESRADLEQVTFGESHYGWQDARTAYHPGWVAHGVVAATAREAAVFLHRLFAGELVSAGLLAEMTAARPLTVELPAERPFTEAAYGLGLCIGDGAFGHSGGGPGSSAAAYHVPEDGLTICVLTDGEDVAEAERLLGAARAAATRP